MKYLVLVFILLLLLPGVAHPHPHAFVEASVVVVFDDEGLAGFKETWVLDPMLTVTVLDLIAENHDGKLDAQEVRALEKESFSNIKEYHYFSEILVNRERYPVTEATDFDASLDGGKVSYSFFVPCRVAANGKPQRVQIALYDETFYTYISYKQEGGKAIDPTKDPLFMNQQAGPNPNDFNRFSQAVGDLSYEGDVYFAGPIEKFNVAGRVEDAPSMSYFYDQIVPQAFVVEFQAK